MELQVKFYRSKLLLCRSSLHHFLSSCGNLCNFCKNGPVNQESAICNCKQKGHFNEPAV